MTASVTNNFKMARNTLTQRPFEKRDSAIPTMAAKLTSVSVNNGSLSLKTVLPQQAVSLFKLSW